MPDEARFVFRRVVGECQDFHCDFIVGCFDGGGEQIAGESAEVYLYLWNGGDTEGWGRR